MTDKKVLPLFVVDTAPTVKWPVKVAIPADGGVYAEFEFTGVFKRMSDAEFDAIAAVQPKVTDGHSVDAGDMSRAEILVRNSIVIPELMVGWEGVRNAAGVTVEFSIEQLRQQITGPNGGALSVGIWRAINEIRYGAKLGN